MKNNSKKKINSEKWHNINWRIVQKNVASKQTELVVAFRNGEEKKSKETTNANYDIFHKQGNGS